LHIILTSLGRAPLPRAVSVEPIKELTDAPFRQSDAGVGRTVIQVDAVAVRIEGSRTET
jgi:hypothetical protein